MLSSRISKRTLKSIITLTSFTLFSAPLYAQAEECMADADCAEGEYCEQIEAPIVTCLIDEDGNESCDEPVDNEPLGFCQERPIECETDSDCPSHLSCGWGDLDVDGSVEPFPTEETDEASADALPPEEESREAPEDPVEPVLPEEGPTMCVFIPMQCRSDDECAMNFHCETYSSGASCGFAPSISCNEDEDCPPPPPAPDCEEEEFTEGFCMPNEIDCNSDEMCPSDWRCREIVDTSCDQVDIAISSSDMDPSEAPSSDSAGGAEAQDFAIEPDQVQCVDSVRSLCVPVGFSGGGIYEDEIRASGEGSFDANNDGRSVEDLDNNDADVTREEGSSNDIEESGGCDASQSAPTTWALLLLLASLGFRRRLI